MAVIRLSCACKHTDYQQLKPAVAGSRVSERPLMTMREAFPSVVIVAETVERCTG